VWDFGDDGRRGVKDVRRVERLDGTRLAGGTIAVSHEGAA